MPTRRRVLSAAGFGGVASLAGCLTDLGFAETAYLQIKVVNAVWRHRGVRWEDEVCWAVSDGESELRCRVAERYRGIVESLDEIRVTGEIERELLRDFEDVTYVVGFCWQGADGQECRNPRASRETFNRVQFDDQAEVLIGSSAVEVVDVYGGAAGDPDEWETEFEPFDFAALHEENGVPIQ